MQALGGDRPTTGRTLVFPNLIMADGGGVAYLPLPSGVDLMQVQVTPEGACPRTTVRAVARNKVQDTQGFQLPIGVAYAIGGSTYAYHWFGDVPLSEGYEWELVVAVKNLSGAAVNFTVNVTIREVI